MKPTRAAPASPMTTAARRRCPVPHPSACAPTGPRARWTAGAEEGPRAHSVAPPRV